MFFKLLYTLCTIIGANSHMETPIMINNTMVITTTTSNTIEISIDEGDTMSRDLCDDFTPNITNTTCTDTLFEASEKVDFMRIANQTMLLKPTRDDAACYGKEISTCFSKTYQLAISALNANDHRLIIDKKFAITVQGISEQDSEKVMFVFVLGGSFFGCLVSSCLKDLFLRLRSEAARMRN